MTRVVFQGTRQTLLSSPRVMNTASHDFMGPQERSERSFLLTTGASMSSRLTRGGGGWWKDRRWEGCGEMTTRAKRVAARVMTTTVADPHFPVQKGGWLLRLAPGC